MPETLSDWMLERLAQDELPQARERLARERLAREPGGGQRLTAIETANTAFLAQADVGAAVKEIRRRAGQRRRGSRPWGLALRLSLALASVGALTLVSVQSFREPRLEETRSKGLEPSLIVYRRAAQGVERLRDGARAKAGDELQLGYAAAGREFGAILSIDGRGQVTLHFPERAGATSGEAMRLEHPSVESVGPVHLGHAYALDDPPGFERFFFVTSKAPFDLQPVLSAAEALAKDPAADHAPLRLAGPLGETSFLLRKVGP
jgi:hypothetical protein